MDLELEQKLNELEFDKKQAFRIIEELLWQTEPVVEILGECSEDEQEFILAFMTQVALHKRIKVDALAAILRRFGTNAQELVDSFELLLDLGLAGYDPISHEFTVVYMPNQDAQEQIAQHRTLIPFLVPPKKATFSNCGMYAIKRPCITKAMDNWDGDICLESIDRKNRVALTINVDVATSVVNKSKSGVKKKPDEDWEDYQKRIESWEHFVQLGIKDVNRIIGYGNKFYLPHQDDKRGRMYDSGYSIKYQGNTYQKACVEFFEQELIPDDEPEQWW